MKICSNEKCKLHLSKESQEGDNCYSCLAPLEEIAMGETFSFSLLFQKISFGRINPKILMVMGGLVAFSIFGYMMVSRLLSKKNNTEGRTIPTVDAGIIKTLNDYIKNERYDSVWAIINQNQVKEALDIEKATTVTISQTDCEKSRNWEVTAIDNKMNIKILPNKEDFNRWVQANNFEKIRQYIHDQGFKVNSTPIHIEDWIQQQKGDKTKKEKYFVLNNPTNGQYSDVDVHDVREPRPRVDLISQFKSGWSPDKVEIKAEVKPEIKNKIESQISGLSELITFAQEGDISDSNIKMILGGVEVSKVNIVVHHINGGSSNENLKNFLTGISINCKKCKIVPISCTPTESVYNGESKNVYLSDIEFLQY